MPPIVLGQYIKPSIPVGGGLDIINGEYYTGIHGEQILSGGLSYIYAFAAKGNAFKSTLTEWMIYTAMGRVSPETIGIFYDTEFNKKEPRMTALQRGVREVMRQLDKLGVTSLFKANRFALTDKAMYSGNKFFDWMKNWLTEKRKDKKNMYETPFVDRDGKSLFHMLMPTFSAIDSLSEFDTDDVADARDKSELGEGAQNILNMRAGLVKANLLTELPRVTVQANNYTIMVAQIGKNMDIGAGQHAQPRQQLKFLKSSEAIKGATAKFSFATHDCWWCEVAKPLWDKDRFPLFPISADKSRQDDTDLMVIEMTSLRCKGGPSGVSHNMVASQSMGILPELTEWYYLHERKNWGLDVSGSGGAFKALELYPDVKVTRNTVRATIEADALFRRALTFTVEMLQMEEHWSWVSYNGIFKSPKEVYENLTARGYDWKVLFDTRGFFVLGGDKTHPQPYLSTMDLWNMVDGKYHPYWYDALVGKEAAAKIIKGPMELVMPPAA
jgi:hypothetical protein